MKLKLRTRIAKGLGFKTKTYNNVLRRQAFLDCNQRDAVSYFPELKEVYDIQKTALDYYQSMINESNSSIETYKRNVDRSMIDSLHALEQLENNNKIEAFKGFSHEGQVKAIESLETYILRHESNLTFENSLTKNGQISIEFHDKYAMWSHAYFESPVKAINTFPELEPLINIERQVERHFSYYIDKSHIDNAVKYYINKSIDALAKGQAVYSSNEIESDAIALQYSNFGRSDLKQQLKPKEISIEDYLKSSDIIASGNWSEKNELSNNELTTSINDIDKNIKLAQMHSAFISYPASHAVILHPELNIIFNKYNAALDFYSQKISQTEAEYAARELINNDFKSVINNEPLQAVSEYSAKEHLVIIDKAKTLISSQSAPMRADKQIEIINDANQTIKKSQHNDVKLPDGMSNYINNLEIETKQGEIVTINNTALSIDALTLQKSKEKDFSNELLEEYLLVNHISDIDKSKIKQAFKDKGVLISKTVTPIKTGVNTEKVQRVDLSNLHSTAPKIELSKIFNTSHLSKTINKDTKFIKYDKEALIKALNNKTENFAKLLLGEPLHNTGEELRFGTNKGSLIITTKGDKAGLWHDHQTGEGGGLLKLIMVEKNIDFKGALKIAADFTGIDPETGKSSSIDLSDLSERGLDEKKLHRISYARQLANDSIDIKGTLADKYLTEQRGIDTNLCSKEIRFIESIKEPSTKKYYPALLVVGKNKDGIVEGVQVTYLDKDGTKAKGLESDKRSYGSIKGSSIPVHEGGNMVAVAEGVETALSVASANPNLTVFSSLGSITNFSSSDFNAQNQTIIICADNDPINNESHKKVNRAADELANKGFNVFIAKPDEVGQDFNDVLISRGADAVKSLINTPVVHRMHGHTNEKVVDRGQSQEKKRLRDVDFGM